MSRIVWLASFPKSGNTWMRFLLSNYLSPQVAGTPVDDLRFAPMASQRLVLDEWSGVETSDCAPDELDDLRQEAYRAVAAAGGPPAFFKVHDAWRRLADGDGLCPADATLAVVYLIRHPFDVVPSFAHHFSTTLERAAERILDERLTIAAGDQVLSPQVPQVVSSWARHVESWCDESSLPVTVVRYEDMRADTIGQLRRVVTMLGLNVDDELLARAVEASRFERLQAQERLKGFPGRPAGVESFFRAGRVGEGRTLLPDALRERIVASAGAVMRRFGYSPEG